MRKDNLATLFFLKRAQQKKNGEMPVYCRISANGTRVELDILNKLTPYGLFKLTPIDNL